MFFVACDAGLVTGLWCTAYAVLRLRVKPRRAQTVLLSHLSVGITCCHHAKQIVVILNLYFLLNFNFLCFYEVAVQMNWIIFCLEQKQENSK